MHPPYSPPNPSLSLEALASLRALPGRPPGDEAVLSCSCCNSALKLRWCVRNRACECKEEDDPKVRRADTPQDGTGERVGYVASVYALSSQRDAIRKWARACWGGLDACFTKWFYFISVETSEEKYVAVSPGPEFLVMHHVVVGLRFAKVHRGLLREDIWICGACFHRMSGGRMDNSSMLCGGFGLD